MTNLKIWAETMAARFGGTVYLVGSSLDGNDARDLDIRITVPDEQFAARYRITVDRWTNKAHGKLWICDVAHFNEGLTKALKRNVDLQIWPESKFDASHPYKVLADGSGCVDASVRLRNWDTELNKWAERMQGQPFVWGLSDCASLVRDACHLMYGREIFDLPWWKTQDEMVEAVRDGVTAILETIATPVGRRFVQTGDIVQVLDGCPYTKLDALLVVVRDHLLASVPKRKIGLVRFKSLAETAVVWRVHATGL